MSLLGCADTDAIRSNKPKSSDVGTTALAVFSDGTGGLVKVIGTAGGDRIRATGIVTVGSEAYEVEASFTAALSIGSGLGVSIDGAGSNDTLSGGGVSTTLFGEAGDDTITGRVETTIGARLGGGDGNDTITGGNAGDSITGGDGVDSLTGGAGIDTIYGGADGDGIWGGDGNDSLYRDAGNDGIYGENHNDMLNGGSGTDYMNGGAGADDFGAQDGEVDTLEGGSGNDVAFVDNDYFNWVFDESLDIETIFYP